MILDHDDARLFLALSVRCHGMGRTPISTCSGTRQVTIVPLLQFDRNSLEPPMHGARYRMMRRPIPSDTALVSNPLPSSRAVSTMFL